MDEDFSDMPLLAKWMNIAKSAFGIDLGDGSKTGWEEVLLLLLPGHCEYEALYARVAPLLPEHTRSAFAELRAMRTPQQTMMVEAARNRIRSKLYFENFERLRERRS